MTKTPEMTEWVVIVTALGSTVARVNIELIEESVTHGINFIVYDACNMIQRPEMVYVPENLESYSVTEDDVSNLIFSEHQAKNLGYVWTSPDDEEIDLVQIEGKIVSDYLPIRPNRDIVKTRIAINPNAIIYYHPLDSYQEIERYINTLMGRPLTKNIPVTKSILEELDNIDGKEQESGGGARDISEEFTFDEDDV